MPYYIFLLNSQAFTSIIISEQQKIIPGYHWKEGMYNDTKFVQKQLDVMKILWDAGTPLVASDIVKAESSMNINTVQASLRVLLKENLIEIADIVYSGTVLSRSYRPLISRDVYFNAEYKNIIGNSSTSAMIATFIEKEEDISELERIEELIRKRMKELEEAQ